MSSNLYHIATKIKKLAKIEKTSKSRLDFNSAITRRKLRSEIVRILFYLYMGYEGPHPWGRVARPIYPETHPLPLRDKNAGKEVRESIEKIMDDSYFEQWIRVLLRTVKNKIEKKK